jgi:hypothetical protein
LSHDPSSKTVAAFQFPKPKSSELKVAYKRYQDADLVEVPTEIAIAGMPLQPSRTWPWMLVGAVLVVTAVVVPIRLRRQYGLTDIGPAYAVPAIVTPFTTLNLLRKIYSDERLKLTDAQRSELSRDISQIETHYFASSPNQVSAPPLDSTLRGWVERTHG